MRIRLDRRSAPAHGVVLATVLLALAGCGGGASDAGNRETGQSVAAPIAASGVREARVAEAVKKIKPRAFRFVGVTALAVAPDGSAAAAADATGAIRLLDPGSAAAKAQLKPAVGGPGVAALLFSGDGRSLLSASRSSALEVWRVADGIRTLALHGQEQPLRALASSADGSVLASGGEETRVLLWNGSTGRLQRELAGAADFIDAVGVSPDGQRIAAAGGEARVFVWDAASGRLVHTLLGHADEIDALVFSADGRRIVSGGEDGKAIVWDAASGQEVQQLAGPQAAVRALAASADGTRFAAGMADGAVIVWDAASLQVAQQFSAPGTAITSLVFAIADKTSLLVGDDQNRVAVLKLKGN